MSELYGMAELRADIKRYLRERVSRLWFPLLLGIAAIEVGISVLDSVLQLPAAVHGSFLVGLKHTLDHWVLYTTKVGPLGAITAAIWLWFSEQLRKKPLAPDLKRWLRRWSIGIGTFCMLLPSVLVAVGLLNAIAPTLIFTVGAVIVGGIVYGAKKIVDGTAASMGESLGKDLYVGLRRRLIGRNDVQQ